MSKIIKYTVPNSEYIGMLTEKIICDKILHTITNIDDLKFFKFRDLLYDILIYNLNIHNCIWYIMKNIIKEREISEKDILDILLILRRATILHAA